MVVVGALPAMEGAVKELDPHDAEEHKVDEKQPKHVEQRPEAPRERADCSGGGPHRSARADAQACSEKRGGMRHVARTRARRPAASHA